jgi:hypothetical protein
LCSKIGIGFGAYGRLVAMYFETLQHHFLSIFVKAKADFGK